MYLWKLTRINVVTPVLDTLRSVVVVAATEAQARQVAATVAGDEGRATWSQPDPDDVRSNCVAIGEADPSQFPYPGVICADFLEG